MIFISMLDDITKAFPKWCEEFKSLITRRVKDTVDSSMTIIKSQEQLKDTAISLTTRHNTSSIIMSRTYESDQDNAANSQNNSNTPKSDAADSMVDAVIAYISRLHNIPTLKLISNGHFIVAFKDKPIQITNNIYVKIDSINLTTSGMIGSIKFHISSNTLSASEITQFVKKIHQDYLQEIKNSLGNNIYFFDQKTRDGMNPPQVPHDTKDPNAIRNHKAMIISTSPKILSFTMTPFYSNKQFSNIFGKEVREIEQRVKFFIENKDWYDQKGIPYQLGILLSGIPGAGKTSVIRALANYTKRHIINVNFANITTATQLKNLFYAEKLNVYADSSMANSQAFHIPIDQRLYVLEEIDAIGDIVKQRSPTNSTPQYDPINDELTLAEILTVLDGTMEVPGRIIIMTSNHPEVLDKALIRPGRIDLKIKFSNATQQLIKEMYEAYLDTPFPNNLIHQLPNEVLSPAEICQVMFRHFNTNSTPEEVLADLVKTAQTKPIEPQQPPEVMFQHFNPNIVQTPLTKQPSKHTPQEVMFQHFNAKPVIKTQEKDKAVNNGQFCPPRLLEAEARQRQLRNDIEEANKNIPNLLPCLDEFNDSSYSFIS